MASVTKHPKSKYWTAQWRVNGKRISKTTGTAKKPEALRLAHQWEAEARQSFQAGQRQESQTLGDYLEEYVQWQLTQGLTAKHIGIKESIFRKVLPLDQEPKDLTATLLMRRIGQLREENNWAQSTAKQQWRRLNAFLNWLVKTRVLKINVMREITLPDAKDSDLVRPRGTFTPQELRSLYEAAKAGPVRSKATGQQRYHIYRLTYGLALRKQEVLGLTAGDVIMTGDRPAKIKISGKGGKVAILPIPEDLKDELAQLVQEAGGREGKLFPKVGTHFTRDGLRADQEDAMIPRVTDQGLFRDFHALRTSRLTHLADANVPPHILGKMARHSNVTTTLSYYTKVTDDLMETWTNRVAVEDEETATLRQEAEFNKMFGIEDGA